MQSTNNVPGVCDPIVGIWSGMNRASDQIRSGDRNAAAEILMGVIDLASGIETRCVRLIGLLTKSMSATGPELGRVSQEIADEMGLEAVQVFSMITGGDE